MEKIKLKQFRNEIKQSFKGANIEEIDADFIIANVINQPINNLFFINEISFLYCSL